MGQCQACGAPIEWIRTRSGVPTPIDADGRPHWATCTDPDRFRNRLSSSQPGRPAPFPSWEARRRRVLERELVDGAWSLVRSREIRREHPRAWHWARAWLGLE
jgi:hypothetical protein